MIFAEHVTFAYDGVPALAGVGLIGPNGSGKTTLLRTLYAALTPSAGLISVDDTPVHFTLHPTHLALSGRCAGCAGEGVREEHNT